MTRVFSCEFCKNFKNNFFTQHLPTTAFVFIYGDKLKINVRSDGIFLLHERLYVFFSCLFNILNRKGHIQKYKSRCFYIILLLCRNWLSEQNKIKRAKCFYKSFVKHFFKNFVCKATVQLVEEENVFEKVFTCHFSLYSGIVHTFYRIESVFSVFFNIFLFFISLCRTSVQSIETNIAITGMENNFAIISENSQGTGKFKKNNKSFQISQHVSIDIQSITVNNIIV